MVSGRSRIIGLVVAYLNNQFYPEALEKLSKRLQERGYHVLVFMTAKTQGDVGDVIEEILDYQVDGIIAASVALSSELSDRCRSEQVPLVLFNRSQDDPGLASVTSDNFAGGRALAEFLIAGGHQRIAYIAGWEGASTQRDREAGFREACRASGHGCSHGVSVISAPSRGAGSARDVLRLTKGRTRCSWRMITWPLPSWMCFVPSLAFASPRMCRSCPMTMCRRPPGSFDLTTIRQPADQMVDATVAALMAQIDGQECAEKRIQINAPLVIRRSARVPEGWGNEGV